MIRIKNEKGEVLKSYELYEQCCSVCDCKNNYNITLGGFCGGNKFNLDNYNFIYDENDSSLVAFKEDDGSWNTDEKYCFCKFVNNQDWTLDDVINCYQFDGYIVFEGIGYHYNEFIEMWDKLKEEYSYLENRFAKLCHSDHYDYEVTLL